MFEESFKDGKLDGVCKEWYESGQLVAETSYKDGNLVKDDNLDY